MGCAASNDSADTRESHREVYEVKPADKASDASARRKPHRTSSQRGQPHNTSSTNAADRSVDDSTTSVTSPAARDQENSSSAAAVSRSGNGGHANTTNGETRPTSGSQPPPPGKSGGSSRQQQRSRAGSSGSNNHDYAPTGDQDAAPSSQHHQHPSQQQQSHTAVTVVASPTPGESDTRESSSRGSVADNDDGTAGAPVQFKTFGRFISGEMATLEPDPAPTSATVHLGWHLGHTLGIEQMPMDDFVGETIAVYVDPLCREH